MKVSVLLLAHNEADNLPACLAALEWCDDIVVVDSGSTDDSVAIASRRGARVLKRPFDNFAAQRNFGLDHGEFHNPWVLHLDSDEIVTPAFAQGISRLEPPESVDAYQVPFKTILFGKQLRHAAMWPAYQVRLGHVRRLRFIQVGHGQREDLPAERVSLFSEPLLHYSFSHGLKRWLDKHARYAQDEALEIVRIRRAKLSTTVSGFSGGQVARRRAFKKLAAHLPLLVRPLARFFYILVLRRGFLDGRRGLLYAFMLSTYEAMIAILVSEIDMKAGSNRAPRPPEPASRRTTSQPMDHETAS